MFDKLIETTIKIFTLSVKVEHHDKDIERLTARIDKLSEMVNDQSAKIKLLLYAVQNESDKTKMWVEKELAKFERRLPSGKDLKNDEK